ncbi:hypothetical protein BHE74_00035519 [Ensete ventricosum]|nr:hypothetical protein GW17_00032048 [Ensete ventricosum]RWW57678.1 hypothetical protein BHE74_00035519 [Ensete ventricosum]
MVRMSVRGHMKPRRCYHHHHRKATHFGSFHCRNGFELLIAKLTILSESETINHCKKCSILGVLAIVFIYRSTSECLRRTRGHRLPLSEAMEGSPSSTPTPRKIRIPWRCMQHGLG